MCDDAKCRLVRYRLCGRPHVAFSASEEHAINQLLKGNRIPCATFLGEHRADDLESVLQFDEFDGDSYGKTWVRLWAKWERNGFADGDPHGKTEAKRRKNWQWYFGSFSAADYSALLPMPSANIAGEPHETEASSSQDVATRDRDASGTSTQAAVCTICLERPRQARLPCRHSVCCFKCVERLMGECPICRLPFSNYSDISSSTVGTFSGQSSLTEAAVKAPRAHFPTCGRCVHQNGTDGSSTEAASWEYQTKTRWTGFEPEKCEILEEKWRQRVQFVTLNPGNVHENTVDLYAMTQVVARDGHVRKVQRLAPHQPGPSPVAPQLQPVSEESPIHWMAVDSSTHQGRGRQAWPPDNREDVCLTISTLTSSDSIELGTDTDPYVYNNLWAKNKVHRSLRRLRPSGQREAKRCERCRMLHSQGKWYWWSTVWRWECHVCWDAYRMKRQHGAYHSSAWEWHQSSDEWHWKSDNGWHADWMTE